MVLRFMFAFQYRDNSKNLFQVTNQSSLEGSYKNRYDALLVNGLPLVQIELKRSGIEIKKLLTNQSLQTILFWSNHGLFQYVQLFVISNGSILNIWPTISCNRSNKPSFGQM
jgi:type I restriction enzyme R subunit